MYQRLCKPLLSNSFFLFGSRGTGKSTLLKRVLGPVEPLWFDLLDEDEARHFLMRPKLLEERIPQDYPPGSWVVIDEIQKIPALLDLVHRLIENRKLNFALTGSSARKLKRGGANLLAGRAFTNHLHPLTALELGKDFDLGSVLQWGSLPKVTSLATEIEKMEFLRAYCSSYLREEIKEEQLVRRIEPFLRFLDVSAQANSQIINYSKIARDSGTDSKSVERYFEILIDTLLGFFLPPFHRSVRKRQSQKSKFYLFDLGVKRALENMLRVPIQQGTFGYGRAFEHFFILECIRLNDYTRKDFRFSYLRTKDDLEIDLIVERPGEKLLLIEIKSSSQVDEVELSKLKVIKKDLEPCELWIASREKAPRYLEFATVFPWETVLRNLFDMSS